MSQESQIAINVPLKWLHCNGQQLRKVTQAALTWLETHHQHVNALNVFPVPDGDTGTNMLLTMRSAYGRIQDSDEMHVGIVAEKIAHGALMGARGNSGVILSQIWRGLAKELKGKETFDAVTLARALEQASNTAYGGVMRPVEGTILTVIREGASEAIDAAEKSHDLRFMLERVLERCRQSLERTPDLLPVLKQAGVVDSGGQGLVYIFEGMLRYVYGKMEEIKAATAVATPIDAPAQAFAIPESGHIENPYDVQFILMGRNLNVEEVRSRIDAMGDSTVVVGDETTIKVHIHVQDPGDPISYGISLGEITDVVVENMQMQMEEIVGTTPAPPMMPTLPPMPEITVQPGQIGVVAVAAGDGLAEIFRSLGASFVV
ncbi:MAG: DAK2 domain-containing protein, partial [Chloroflexi bacterium]|nr:DAK2 domain-containing protein [Chloroflexota bacterium]